MALDALQFAPPFRPVVVAPTYNHAATLLQVLRKIEAIPLPIIVVNDGSTDDTSKLLHAAMAQPWLVPLHVESHSRNEGKAAAMKTGFNRAGQLGFTHVVTIDTDGQHDANDVPALLAEAAKHPHALILGERSDQLPGYPRGSLMGRKLSNLMINITTGHRISDSQCGLRVYPMALLKTVKCKARRYAFESEILTRSLWAGWPVRGVPISSFYAPKHERISHFRTWRDTIRGVILQARLLGRALMPWPHQRTCPASPESSILPGYSLANLRRYMRSITPARLWSQLRQDATSHASLAAALALGVFIANIPVYPFQSVVALYAATRLHLQPLAVLMGSLLSTPPIGPLLIATAIIVGHLMIHASLPDLSQFRISDLSSAFQLIGQLMIEWILGSVIVGLVLMTTTFSIAWLVLSRLPLRHDIETGEIPRE